MERLFKVSLVDLEGIAESNIFYLRRLENKDLTASSLNLAATGCSAFPVMVIRLVLQTYGTFLSEKFLVSFFAQMNRHFDLASADLVVPNMDAWHLLWDFFTLRQIVDSLSQSSPLQNKALYVANEIMNAFGKGDASDIKRARKIAEQIFGEDWQSCGADIYKEGPPRIQIWGIGHCHIDTAWWVTCAQLCETRA
jgi:alpha-mannosidase